MNKVIYLYIHVESTRMVNNYSEYFKLMYC